jgi:hypothetical protein
VFAAAGTEQKDVHEVSPKAAGDLSREARIRLALQGGDIHTRCHSGARRKRRTRNPEVVQDDRTQARDSGSARVARRPE